MNEDTIEIIEDIFLRCAQEQDKEYVLVIAGTVDEAKDVIRYYAVHARRLLKENGLRRTDCTSYIDDQFVLIRRFEPLQSSRTTIKVLSKRQVDNIQKAGGMHTPDAVFSIGDVKCNMPAETIDLWYAHESENADLNDYFKSLANDR